MRIALGIEYNGSRFHGWQMQQAGVASVQHAVESALSSVANHPVRLHCAGRTDTGVHALEQVVHFDTEVERPLRAWVLGVNAALPEDVAILWAQVVDETFHARFSALSRSYRYCILNRTSRPGLEAKRLTWVHRPLDAERMHLAAQVLRGTHDFTSYRAIACQAKNPLRTVEYIAVERQGERLTLRIRANAFLHHMVRNIAGVLLAVGKGEAGLDWPAEVLALKDRKRGGITAPAHGLYFEHVAYPPHFALPQRPR
jgi:tRNA pseudouridine38-40 synthase